jgi:hypothetical protein
MHPRRLRGHPSKPAVRIERADHCGQGRTASSRGTRQFRPDRALVHHPPHVSGHIDPLPVHIEPLTSYLDYAFLKWIADLFLYFYYKYQLNKLIGTI